MTKLNSKIPQGPLASKWTNYKNQLKLVAPNNRPKIDIIVVGTGLAGASAAASLGEMGYNVKAFCFKIPPAGHSMQRRRYKCRKIIKTTATVFIACFTIPLKEVIIGLERECSSFSRSITNIIDQCRSRVPFAREYGGMLDVDRLGFRYSVLSVSRTDRTTVALELFGFIDKSVWDVSKCSTGMKC